MSSALKQGKRITLMNRRSLLTLTVVTVALLWALRPNKEVLVSMLAQAQDPTVALAFLHVLEDKDHASLQLDLLIAKNHLLLDETDKAWQRLNPIARFEGSEYYEQALDLYGKALLADISRSKIDSKAFEHFVNNANHQLSDEQRDHFASIALQMRMPKLAYSLLSAKERPDNMQLIALAMQADMLDQAIEHAQQEFKQSNSDRSFTTLLDLYLASERYNQGLALVNSVKTWNPDKLRAAMKFTRGADFAKTYAQLSNVLAQTSTDPQDWRSASVANAAIGNIERAAYWLEKAMQQETHEGDIAKLHDYYLWQGDIDKALAMSKQLISATSAPTLINQGVSEARAVADLPALADFLFYLALNNRLNDEAALEWVNLNDKAFGAQATIQRLEQLHKNQRSRSIYWFQLARFYNFAGQPNRAIALWNSLNTERMMRFEDAYLFANNFIAQQQLTNALAILTEHVDLRSLTIAQMYVLQDLASYLADNTLTQKLLTMRLELNDNDIDPFQMISAFSEHTDADHQQLWRYYQQTKSFAVLTYLASWALTQNDQALIATTEQALLENHHGNASLNAQLLRLQFDLHHQRYLAAQNKVQQLLAQYPQHQDVQTSAMWLALITNDDAWAHSLYWRYAPTNQNNTQMYLPFAALAQQLGLFTHSDTWYQKLADAKRLTIADQLAWADVKMHQGNELSATHLRWQALKTLQQRAEIEPQLTQSYQSLIYSLASTAHASTLIYEDVVQGFQPRHFGDLSAAFSTLALQQIALVQAHNQVNASDLQDSVALALAMAQKDRSKITALVSSSQTLTALERSEALRLIGEHALAWKVGELGLNAKQSNEQRRLLNQAQANVHHYHAHSLRYEHLSYDSWGVQGERLDYFRPTGKGQWNSFYEYGHGTPETPILDSYKQQMLGLAWRSARLGDFTQIESALQWRQRFGEDTFGASVSASIEQNHHLTHQFTAKYQMPSLQSETLFLMGYESSLSWLANWRITRYEQLSFNLQRAQYHSDFDDPIGQGWQGNLRFAERISSAPNWQLYAQYDLQHNSLDERPLTKLSAYLRPGQEELTSQSFLSERYERFALGQQLVRGEVSRPGPGFAEFRYLLDTAVGYNFEQSQIDYSANLSVGTRLFGGDELFLKGTWQSADQNGRENLTINLGYFIDF